MGKEEKIIISKVEIKMTNSDKSNFTINTKMPKEIAEHMFCAFTQWKDNWLASFNDHKKYEEAVKKFK